MRGASALSSPSRITTLVSQRARTSIYNFIHTPLILTAKEMSPPPQVTLVYKVLEIYLEAQNKPGDEVTTKELQNIVDAQDPPVQESWYDGLGQLLDLVEKGPLPHCIIESLEGTPPVAGLNVATNTNHYPNAYYGCNSSKPISQHQIVPPPRSQSPPRSGALRRPTKKRGYEADRNSPFTRCKWNNCGQAVEKSATSVISHLVSLHKIDLKSRFGSMRCNWDGCGEDLLIVSASKHITSTHLRLTVVVCPYCPDNMQFCRQDSLDAHIKAQHSNMSSGPSPKKVKVQ